MYWLDESYNKVWGNIWTPKIETWNALSLKHAMHSLPGKIQLEKNHFHIKELTRFAVWRYMQKCDFKVATCRSVCSAILVYHIIKHFCRRHFAKTTCPWQSSVSPKWSAQKAFLAPELTTMVPHSNAVIVDSCGPDGKRQEETRRTKAEWVKYKYQTHNW